MHKAVSDAFAVQASPNREGRVAGSLAATSTLEHLRWAKAQLQSPRPEPSVRCQGPQGAHRLTVGECAGSTLHAEPWVSWQKIRLASLQFRLPDFGCRLANLRGSSGSDWRLCFVNLVFRSSDPQGRSLQAKGMWHTKEAEPRFLERSGEAWLTSVELPLDKALS